MRRRDMAQRGINVGIYNVKQRRVNVVIFNVEFYNVGKHLNNVVKMTISKKNKNRIYGIQSFNYCVIIFILLSC